MGLIHQNLKFLRKKEGLTQQQLADKLEVKRAVIGAYEEQRAEPKTELLRKMAKLFGITIDDFTGDTINDKWFSKRAKQAADAHKKAAEGFRVLSITVDSTDRENIELVPVKASAGYLSGHADPEFVAELPKFHLPFLKGGTFRAFEINGDSMLPLQSGSIVVGEYVEDFSSMKNGDTYIVISRNDGIVYKRVTNQIKDKQKLLMVSDNKSYDPYAIDAADVLEVWKAKAFISTSIPMPLDEPSLAKLTDMVEDLQRSMSDLKHMQREKDVLSN